MPVGMNDYAYYYIQYFCQPLQRWLTLGERTYGQGRVKSALLEILVTNPLVAITDFRIIDGDNYDDNDVHKDEQATPTVVWPPLPTTPTPTPQQENDHV